MFSDVFWDGGNSQEVSVSSFIFAKNNFFGGASKSTKKCGKSNPSSPIEIASTIYCNSKSYMLHETRIIFIYMWIKFMVHVAQYFIDEAYGQYKDLLKMVVPQV